MLNYQRVKRWNPGGLLFTSKRQNASKCYGFSPVSSKTKIAWTSTAGLTEAGRPYCAPRRIVPITTPAVSVGTTHGLLHSSRDFLTQTRETLDRAPDPEIIATSATDPEIGVVMCGDPGALSCQYVRIYPPGIKHGVLENGPLKNQWCSYQNLHS